MHKPLGEDKTIGRPLWKNVEEKVCFQSFIVKIESKFKIFVPKSTFYFNSYQVNSPLQFDLHRMTFIDNKVKKCYQFQEERDIEAGAAIPSSRKSTPTSSARLRDPKSVLTLDDRNVIRRYPPTIMPKYTGYIPARRAENVFAKTYSQEQKVCKQICNRGRLWDGLEGAIRLPAPWAAPQSAA